MDDWKLPWEGGCRCERVRFKVTQPPIMSMACHCAGCQKMSSSAFSLSLMIPAAGFEITQGETEPGGLQEALDHRFCGFCKTWMYTQFDRAVPFVNLRPTMLDEYAWFSPFTESCVTEKLPWAVTGTKHSFPQFPPPEDRPSLMAAFAKEGARPA
jgi:hypothetical protein